MWIRTHFLGLFKEKFWPFYFIFLIFWPCSILTFMATQHSCLVRPNKLPRKYFIRYNFAKSGKEEAVVTGME